MEPHSSTQSVSDPAARPMPRIDEKPPSGLQTQDAAAGICRICRGEGTSAEPLFYPCKCSGSIKYVHQDCLMEWLSHSQKKYCELCKTSFRFTKLYAPDMPQSLPVLIFLEHMARYFVRNVLVWLRAIVTISVWVCWLPYFMRSVWSFMFWVSDEGLGTGSILARLNAANGPDPNTLSALMSSAGGTSPASPLFVPTMTSAVEAASLKQALTSNGVPVALINFFLGGIGISLTVNGSGFGEYGLKAATLRDANLTTATSSLLGDVNVLRNLTRSPTVNRTVISVLEGQIITILVIVCFILVILVRDYVVQHQPEINMQAAFADGEAEPEPQEIHRHEEIVVAPPEPDASEDSDDETLDEGNRSGTVEGELELNTSIEHNNDVSPPKLRDPAGREDPQNLLSNRSHSSEMNRDARKWNDSRYAPAQATVSEYWEIVRRAEANPERILKIIHDEGLEEKLSFWVDANRRSMGDISRMANTVSETPIPDNQHQIMPGSMSGEAGATMTRHSSIEHSDDSLINERAARVSSSAKGKERAWEPSFVTAGLDTPLHSENPLPGPSRPRATSDGPQPQTSTNPLGSNNWSFNGLPPYPGQDYGDFSMPVFPPPGRFATTGEISPANASTTTGGFPPTHDTFTQDLVATNQSRLRPTIPATEENAHTPDDGPAIQDVVVVPEDPAEPAPGGLVGRVANFMWGNLEEHQQAQLANEEHDIHDEAHEVAWVDLPVAENVEDDVEGNLDGVGEDEDDDAARQEANAEAVEEMDDFEGVMELIGMRGPIAGLFQNAIFCSVLVSVTIFTCIFLPYNVGRISVWIMAHPMRLIRMLLEFSKLVQDITIMLGGLASWCALNIVDIAASLLGKAIRDQVITARKASWAVWLGARSRIFDYVFMDFPMSATEMQNFSAVSHDALITVKANIASVLPKVGATLTAVIGGDSFSNTEALSETLADVGRAAIHGLCSLWTFLSTPNSWIIDLSEPERDIFVNPDLAYWSGMDRFWAILAGYAAIFSIGALYLRRGSPFSRGDIMQAWEAGVIDTLHQASGIMKVIIVISIEMLVFPLYCGLLLDVALLPLFENATFKTRMLFTYKFPLTSVFVHWFVGTGYMFHFALFVSMCRKIMRPGVLYFIRDPDDPGFHPVRDVLERNLTTQLRKIVFSAFVYGALVIICLGGVVWGLSFTVPGVLPIHYSSNEPVLEFPVDLLFYNFLIPLAVKFFRPSDGLHIMYTWWFRKCARGLRLSYFLFGERRIDEEGILRLQNETSAEPQPYNNFLLELSEENKVIPKTWRDTFDGGHAKPTAPLSKTEMRDLRHKKQHLVRSGELIESGRFVRAPATDRVKIPKGKEVFLTVSERNRRKDGKPDEDMYSSDQYQVVYVPPGFRTRVFLFILLIWAFAAVTGVGFTILPLVFGRAIFKTLIPAHIRTNDIYAFSIGICLLGSVVYFALHLRDIKTRFQSLRQETQGDTTGAQSSTRIWAACVHGIQLLYTYFFVLIVFPLMLSMMMELYLTIPLHTYMNPLTTISTLATESQDATVRQPGIRIIQSWTLGLLYLKLGSQMITSLFPDTRAALAVRTVMLDGWLRPQVGVLTRAFVLPGVTIAAAAVFGPPLTTKLLLQHGFIATGKQGLGEAAEAARLVTIYRHSYPVAALVALFLKNAFGMVKVFNGWTASIRDEAYLIGERLHNFGAAAAGSRKTGNGWRAGGTRL